MGQQVGSEQPASAPGQLTNSASRLASTACAHVLPVLIGGGPRLATLRSPARHQRERGAPWSARPRCSAGAGPPPPRPPRRLRSAPSQAYQGCQWAPFELLPAVCPGRPQRGLQAEQPAPAARGCNHLVQSSTWARTRRGAARAGRGAHRAPQTGCASPPCPAPSPGTSRRLPRRPRGGACGSVARERAPRGSLRAERAEPGSETRRAPLDGVEAHGGVAAGLVRIDHEHRDPRAVLHGQAGRGGQRLLGPGAQVRVLVQDGQQQVLVANGVRRLPLAPASLQRGRCSEGTAAPQAVPPDIQEVGARVRPSCTNIVGMGQGKVGRCSRTASRSAAEAQLAPLCWRSPRPAAVPARQCRSMAQNSDRQCRSRWGKARKKRTVLQPAPHSLKRWACAVRTAHKALRVGGQCRMCGGGYAA